MEIKNRTDLANYFAECGFNLGVEVGVATGLYSEILCKANPNLHLFSVDPWYTVQRACSYDEAKQRLAAYNATLVRKTSMEAVNDFADASLDFVYIDGNHSFDFVMYDILGWTRKVKKGGIVAGHDYVVGRHCGVITAVDAYTKSHLFRISLTQDVSESISWWFKKYWNV
jgi:hypothetical protein